MAIDKKKIVLISKDAMGCFYLPVYGGTYWQTPNIDELASKGTVFRRHYTAAPSTAMAFISMFAGIYPFETGIRDYRPLEKDKVFHNTLFDKLMEQGYSNHIIWASTWNNNFASYSNVYENATFHYIDNMSQPVGGKFPHDGRLMPDEKAVQEFLRDFEGTIAEVINATDKTFTWVHFPHVIRGRTGMGRDIEVFDACIGIVRKYTTDENIFITADHGNMNGHSGKVGYGFDVYEPAIRIPLITPRMQGMANYEDVTSNIDLAEMILNNRIVKRDYIVSDSTYYAQKNRKLAIVDKRYKYIFNKENGVEELYDVLFDTNENINIVNMKIFDVDRRIYHPLEEAYYYPFWDESREALEKFRREKSNIWREPTLQEKIYHKLKRIMRME